MSLVQGSEALPDQADQLEVVYEQPFVQTPPVVLCVVENTSADPVKLAISVTVTDSSPTGFTASLSQQTNTANYKLVWYVSDPATLIALVNTAFSGRRISHLDLGQVLVDDDILPVVKAYPVPHTKRIRWKTIRQQLAGAEQADVLMQGDAPASDAAGDAGDRLYDPTDPGWVYECVVGGTAGNARWVRYAVANY